MSIWAGRIEGDVAASRWRHRMPCVLAAPGGAGGTACAIRTISARGALIDTDATPALGAAVSLRHPEAGALDCRVEALRTGGLALRFDASEAAMAFALAAVAADMSRPG